jgi:colanic acid biosynthesis glycosyl transferase WcaI
MNYAPEKTGVGRFSGELGSYLSHRGVDVDVITTAPHYPGWTVAPPYSRSRYQRETLDGVAVFRCPAMIRQQMRGIWRLLAPLSFALTSAPVALWRILWSRPDVVLAVEPTLLVAPVAVLAARLVGADAVLHVQDLEVDAAFAVGHLQGKWWQRLACFWERGVLAGFDCIVTISEEMRSQILRKGVAADKVCVIRNWVDTRKIVPLTTENSFRRELGISENRFVALYAGSVGAKQSLDIVLTAAEAMEKDCDALIVIAGEGPEKNRLISRYGHLANVRFLPIQPEERLCELLNLADVHLLPQDRNAAELVLPSKLGGMLASGRAILAAAEPGTELYRFLSGVATIVPTGDSVQVAQKIRELAGNPPARLEKAHELVSYLDAESNLRRFIQVLGLERPATELPLAPQSAASSDWPG